MRPTLMQDNIKVAFYPLKCNGRRKPKMAIKLFFLSLIVICVTFLVFTWITEESLCELIIRQGGIELVASLAYESRR
ncbi:Hok/Gef family protein [Pantoea sp. B65]|uniref:Hok/Gef family protein n=1 Tax=Pantoea sp. B65 TaxID=2813359 RepID=UPI0039B4AE0B